MKALTILEPFASLIAYGAKKIETRSWATKYRGPIAIHAGQGTKYLDLGFKEPFLSVLAPHCRISEKGNPGLAFNGGYVIAIADLVDCQEMTMEKIICWKDVYGKEEIAFGHFEPGRYAWLLENVRQIDPVPAKGMQRLWNWEVPYD